MKPDDLENWFALEDPGRKAHKTVYTRHRSPKQIAPGTCKGCHGPITDPKRKTWCKDACYQRYDPTCVKKAVKARDKHVCQLCGLDVKAERRMWKLMKPHPLTATRANMRAWRKARPCVEIDHIVPFSEGGHTVLENMRTLCTACHKQRTKEWLKAKKEAKNGQVDRTEGRTAPAQG